MRKWEELAFNIFACLVAGAGVIAVTYGIHTWLSDPNTTQLDVLIVFMALQQMQY
jgi:hypothetical protein